VIDAHQHFWRLARGDYAWLTPDLGVLYRDFGPADLEPLMIEFDVDRSVLVQAAPSLEETQFLLEIADATSWVAGVVGWVDLDSPTAGLALAKLAGHGAVCGVRPMIQDIPDPDWMLRDALTPALRAVVEHGLAFDALIRPEHLPRLLQLLERHRDLRLVIDHAAKPAIAQGHFEPWARDIECIARETGACCKLSGLVTEAAANWSDDSLRPYCEHLFECFGAERILWGSDWPVVELAGGFARWREASLRLLSSLDASQRAGVLGGNAERFYRLSGQAKESR
jgi:L-fuconolactonase